MLGLGRLDYAYLVQPRLSKVMLYKIRQSRPLETKLRGEKILGWTMLGQFRLC
jgi:hypothetical protein